MPHQLLVSMGSISVGFKHTQALASPGLCSWDTSTLAGRGCQSGERISVEIHPSPQMLCRVPEQPQPAQLTRDTEMPP